MLVDQMRRDFHLLAAEVSNPKSTMNIVGENRIRREAFDHPVFFFAHDFPVPKGGRMPAPDSLDVPVPFENFWLVYRTPNGHFRPNTNAVYYDGEGDEPRLLFALKSDDSQLNQAWTNHGSFDFSHDYSSATQGVK